MTHARFENLKQTTQSIKEAATPEDKATYLDQAFELFRLETEKLAGAYWNLQKKFEAVNLELQSSNEQLNRKVVELNFTTNYLDSILSQMAQGLLFIDLKGIITTYNKEAEELLGQKNEEVLLRPFWSLFADDFFGFSLHTALAEQSAPSHTLFTIKIKNNDTREVETNINFLLQDSIQGVIILLRDITEIRSLQVQAARNDRLKELGEMAAMVAHEIRNPLGGIKGFASLLERDLKEHPEMARMAAYIIEGTDTLNRLVGTVLNYSRPIQLRLEATDLTALMQELIEHIHADSSVPVNVVLQVEKGPPVTAPVDPAILKGAALNLVTNSIQAMPQGGTVTITVSEEGRHALIQIADTGIGIPPENMGKLFSPFFTTRSEGNGFGLAEVYKVIQAHSGSIEAGSTVGEGTLFTIKLPLQIGKKNGH